jgi:hypothetical protein
MHLSVTAYNPFSSSIFYARAPRIIIEVSHAASNPRILAIYSDIHSIHECIEIQYNAISIILVRQSKPIF